MSMDIHVFLNKAEFPTVAAWQTAMHDAGFPVDFDPNFDPIIHSGFAPCKLRETETGFQYFLSSIDDVASAYPDIADPVHRYDSAATFSWGGCLDECAAALAAAGSLAASCAGAMYDPQEGLLYDSLGALQYAKQVYGQIAPLI